MANSAPIVEAGPHPVTDGPATFTLVAVSGPSAAVIGASGTDLVDAGIVAGVLPEALPLANETISPEQEVANSELDEYTRELFHLMAMIEAQQEAELRRREAMQRNEEALASSPLMPMIQYAREMLKNFILGEDDKAEVSLLADYNATAGANGADPSRLGAVEVTSWSTESASRNQVHLNSQAPQGSEQSFLHRLFCKVGLLEPTAVGMNEDCEYIDS